MKKLLLLASILSTPVIALDGDYSLIKKNKDGVFGETYSLYQGNVSGKCYLEVIAGHRGFLSEVDCSDHNISLPTIKNNDSNYSDDFIKNNCTKPKRGMNGKYYAQCEIDADYLERQEFLRLKGKFGKGE